MGKVVVFTNPKAVDFEFYDDRPLEPHEVRDRLYIQASVPGQN